MRSLLILITTILLMVTITIKPVLAAEPSAELSPYTALENVGNKLFSRIAANQQEIKKFPEYMRVIVEEDLMPAIDYKYAAYKILGKNLSKIDKQQRKKFVASMKHYLIRTYAQALSQYKNQQVIYERDKNTKGKRIVAVKTQIIDINAPTIDVIFKMRKNKKTGQWKAFDMVIEGISLLSTKQAELSKRISKQGIDQVTLELASLSK